jgi:hypothetical protein
MSIVGESKENLEKEGEAGRFGEEKSHEKTARPPPGRRSEPVEESMRHDGHAAGDRAPRIRTRSVPSVRSHAEHGNEHCMRRQGFGLRTWHAARASRTGAGDAPPRRMETSASGRRSPFFERAPVEATRGHRASSGAFPSAVFSPLKFCERLRPFASYAVTAFSTSLAKRNRSSTARAKSFPGACPRAGGGRESSAALVHGSPIGVEDDVFATCMLFGIGIACMLNTYSRRAWERALYAEAGIRPPYMARRPDRRGPQSERAHPERRFPLK